MSSKMRKRYPFLRKTEWFISDKALSLLVVMLRWCPMRFLPPLAGLFGTIGYYLGGSRRTLALKNMDSALGATTTESERKTLVRKLFKGIALDLLEVVRSHSNPAQIGAMDITVRGQEHLDKALKKGHGVIAVSAHISNFFMVGAQLAHMGYPSWLIFKHPHSPGVAQTCLEWTKRVGIRAVTYAPSRVCAHESLKVLKSNGIVQLLVDQNPLRRYGTYVEFFGQWVPTIGGPIVMARRSGAAVVPMYMHREDDSHLVLTILPELTVTTTETGKTLIAGDLRKINRLYEAWIRAYPSQWWWIHRRFRHARTSPPE